MCRGVTREYCDNISHDGFVASIIANLLRPSNVRYMTWVSYHFRSLQNRSQFGPTGKLKLTRFEDAPVLVIGR
jgi:hypothetical protein